MFVLRYFKIFIKSKQKVPRFHEAAINETTASSGWQVGIRLRKPMQECLASSSHKPSRYIPLDAIDLKLYSDLKFNESCRKICDRKSDRNYESFVTFRSVNDVQWSHDIGLRSHDLAGLHGRYICPRKGSKQPYILTCDDQMTTRVDLNALGADNTHKPSRMFLCLMFEDVKRHSYFSSYHVQCRVSANFFLNETPNLAKTAFDFGQLLSSTTNLSGRIWP